MFDVQNIPTYKHKKNVNYPIEKYGKNKKSISSSQKKMQIKYLKNTQPYQFTIRYHFILIILVKTNIMISYVGEDVGED